MITNLFENAAFFRQRFELQLYNFTCTEADNSRMWLLILFCFQDLEKNELKMYYETTQLNKISGIGYFEKKETFTLNVPNLLFHDEGGFKRNLA